MGNRETAIARRYHEATKHSYRSVRSDTHFLDWDNKPLPYKIYPDLPALALPREFPPLAADALSAAGALAPLGEEGGSFDLGSLARLLFFSAGVTKKIRLGGQDLYFRAAACAGALYPVELYVVAGEIQGLPAGVYHFSPGDFLLRRLREGDWRGWLSRAVADEGVARAPATIVLSAIFWRSAWKYRARCYRYCYWDAGMILANLLAVAAAGGQRAKVLAGFVDTDVDRLLGLDGAKEASLCLVPLGAGEARTGAPSVPSPPPIAPEVVPLSESEVEYPAIGEVHGASRLGDEGEVREWRGAPRRRSGPRGGREKPSAQEATAIPLRVPPAPPSAPLLEAIRRRGSTRQFAREAIPFEELSAILTRSTGGVPADFLGASAHPGKASSPEPPSKPGLQQSGQLRSGPVAGGPGTSLLDLYLIANAVEGLRPGSYYFSPGGGGLERLREGNFRGEAGHICLEQTLAADASAVVFFLANLESALARLGNRGYRAAQLEVGTVGGKLYLAAYGQGRGASGLTFYDDDMVRFFAPHSSGKDAIFVVALGVPARGR